MYADGLGLAEIAKTLNAEAIPSPQTPRTRLLRAWCPSSVREMLRNERYRGVQVWNRTEKQRNPETGRKISKARPETDWVRVDVPEWRIVSEDLWNAVQSRIVVIKERMGVSRYGGTARTSESRQYLFSGLLICGVCGSRLVIVSGNGRRGYVKYGCPSHRYRGVCSNRLTIRRDRLEAQLLAAIEERVLTPELIDYTIRRFEEALAKRLEENRGSDARATSLVAEQRELQGQAHRLSDAIAAAGHSPSLLSHLASVEARLARVQQQIEACNPTNLMVTAAEARSFVMANVMNLRSRLHEGQPARARTALMKHVKQLVLTPEERPTGQVYAVSGSVDVPVSKKNNVMPVVARDGIEPPTPAFSGAPYRTGGVLVWNQCIVLNAK